MSFFAELKRRNVFRVAAAYAVVAWLLIEVSDTVFPRLGLPEWTVTLVIALLLLGVPVALFFAWAYELTPEGLKREQDVDRSESITPYTAKKLDRVIMVVLALGLAFDDMSQAGDQEYLSDGIAEELLNLLAKIPDLPAHAALAHSWLVSEQLDTLGKDFERQEIDAAVEPLLQRALELAPDLPEAIAIQGLHDLRRDRYEDARQAFDRALGLNPNYALAYTWRGEALSRLTHRPPLLTQAELNVLCRTGKPDTARIMRELGWHPTPFTEGLARTLTSLQRQAA